MHAYEISYKCQLYPLVPLVLGQIRQTELKAPLSVAYQIATQIMCLLLQIT
jgi:hypothetical protein